MPDPRRRNGFALIVVLNIIVILSGIAIVAAQGAREGAAISANLRSDAQQRSLAEGAMAVAAERLLSAEAGRRWQPDGRPYRIHLFSAEAAVSIQDESGKLNLNTTDEVTLAAAFTNAGVASSKAQALAAAIVDWRDPDSERRLSGAERPDYMALGISGAPANSPFNRVDELRGVLGMTDESYKTIALLVTAYPGDSSVRLDVAPLPVLTALFGRGSPEISAILARRSNSNSVFGGVANAVGVSRSDGLTRQVGSATAATYSVTVALPKGAATRFFRGAFRLQQDSSGPRMAVLEPMALVPIDQAQ